MVQDCFINPSPSFEAVMGKMPVLYRSFWQSLTFIVSTSSQEFSPLHTSTSGPILIFCTLVRLPLPTIFVARTGFG